MKKWILIRFVVALSISFSAFSYGNISNGSMKCRVTDNSVSSIENGEAKKYKGFADSFSINDELQVDYLWDSQIEQFKFVIRHLQILLLLLAIYSLLLMLDLVHKLLLFPIVKQFIEIGTVLLHMVYRRFDLMVGFLLT